MIYSKNGEDGETSGTGHTHLNIHMPPVFGRETHDTNMQSHVMEELQFELRQMVRWRMLCSLVAGHDHDDVRSIFTSDGCVAIT